MRVVIIEDKDAKALLEKLELQKMREENHIREGMTIDQMRRAFHYIVCRWLQDQGANPI